MFCSNLFLLILCFLLFVLEFSYLPFILLLSTFSTLLFILVVYYWILKIILRRKVYGHNLLIIMRESDSL